MHTRLSANEAILWRIEREGRAAAPFSDCPRSLGIAYHLRGDINVDALDNAVAEVVHRHAVMRSSFRERHGRVARIITSPNAIHIRRRDIRSITSGTADVIQAIAEVARQPFDLEKGPLYRATLCHIDHDHHVFIFNVHHLVFDAWSRGIFLNELMQLYDALSAGRASPLAPLTATYWDYIDWQARQINDVQLDHWHKRIESVNGPAWPQSALTSTTPPDVPTTSVKFVIPPAQLRSLKMKARKSAVTLPTALLAAYATVVSRVTGRDDILIGVPISDRPKPAFEKLIGLFINMLVVRVSVTRGSPAARIAKVRDAVYDAMRDRHLPYGYCVRTHPIFFCAVFDFVKAVTMPFTLAGIDTDELLVTGAPISQSGIALHVREASDMLICSLHSRPDLCSDEHMQAFISQWMCALVEMC